MRFGDSLYLLCGVWALGLMGLLITAIRLSYRIEARSAGLQNTSGVPRNAMILHTVMNWHVARDEETQALRRAMNIRLALVAAGFALMALGLRLSGAFD